ncbi:hypothetical protein AB0H88_09950 [Nonomuraea sp. NPDC050680]|uniref:hypothetical protein n=1 Tax=Nonomuraea sp. NPDC050680 TaxID=3154630 RepID=UPI00340A5AED
MPAGELAEFHGPHVAPPTPEHVKLTWHQPPRASRIRVIFHTCECRETTYELCATAGQSFVRRTDRTEQTVRETPWTLTAIARHVFEQILRGKAR